MPPAIHLVTEQEAEQIAAIYAPLVRNTIISFETVLPDPAPCFRLSEPSGERTSDGITHCLYL